ncbi:MAG: YfhO family protein, partial [Peptostreptococcaceae bacterium]
MLPLVIIGVEEIVKKDKWVIFFASILITFVSNFYMSYMVGIFSFIYFVGIYVCNYSFKNNIKLFFKKFGMFMGATFLAVGSCAVLLVPTFLAIKNGGVDAVGSVNMYDVAGIGGMISKALRVMSKLFIGAYDSLTTTRGTANIYSGIIVFLLVPVFFTSKKISKKEKMFNAFVIILLFIGFVDPMSNLLWHALDTPTGFPSRYSYIFTFMLLSISYKGLMMVIKDKNREISLNKISIFAIGFIIIQAIIIFAFKDIESIPAGYVSNSSIILSLVFVGVYSILLNRFRKINIKKCSSILAVFIVVELICSTSMILGGLDREVAYKNKDKYDFVSKLDKHIKLIKNNDKSFYRIETDSIRSLNDSMNLNFNGIKHFSSMANKGLHQFLNDFGFANSDFDLAMSYYGATPISDSLLGVKYVVSKNDKPEDYKKIYKGEGRENIYLNENVLPLLYMVNKDTLSLKNDYKNPFEMQNDMLNLMVGHKIGSKEYKHYFKRMDIDKFELQNLKKIDKKSSSRYNKIKPHDKAYIEFKAKDDINKRVYLYVPTMGRTSMDILVDEMYLDSYGGYYNNTIFGVNLNDNKEANVKLSFNRNSIDLGDIHAYSFDDAAFRDSIHKLRRGGARDLVVNNTNVSGTVECKDDEMLFTSIPFDPGWKVYVDGKESVIEPMNDAFIGVKMDKGVHDVR